MMTNMIFFINMICIAIKANAMLSLLWPLSYRVPDLKFDLFPFDVDHPCPELYSDGQVMDRLETFVGKLE